MAWARPPGAPELPASPLEALTPRKNPYRSLGYVYGLPLTMAITGALFPPAVNLAFRRPFYAGIWKSFFIGGGMGLFGVYLNDLYHEILDDKDEVLRQYMALHPEDFPPYKRKLIKDTIESWRPTR